MPPKPGNQRHEGKITAGKGPKKEMDSATRTKQKTILSSPFVYCWASISQTEAETTLSHLEQLLAPISFAKRAAAAKRTAANEVARDLRIQKTQESEIAAAKSELESLKNIDKSLLSIDAKLRLDADLKRVEVKRKRLESSVASKKRRLDIDEEDEEEDVKEHPLARETKDSLVIGINSLTKELQKPTTKIRAIFVCKSDVPVPHLYAHLPTLCHLHSIPVLLIPLHMGAESRIAQALGVKSVIALGIKQVSPLFDSLFEHVRGFIQPVNLPWLPKEVKKGGNQKDGDGDESMDGNGTVTKAPAYMQTNLKTLNVVEGKKGGGWNNRNNEHKKKVEEKEKKQRELLERTQKGLKLATSSSSVKGKDAKESVVNTDA